MASEVYQKGKDEIAKQNLDVVGSANIVAIPMSESYTPDPKNHEHMSDVASDELDCDGYDGGFGGADRVTPSGRTWRRDDGDTPGRIEFDHDDFTLQDLGGGVSDNNDVIGGFLYIEERTDDTDSPIVAFDTLQDNRATNGSDITRSTDAEGVFYLE